ncbi:hypothetical protein ACLESO_23945 [Pyxidicoccus sp. 3LG]
MPRLPEQSRRDHSSSRRFYQLDDDVSAPGRWLLDNPVDALERIRATGVKFTEV